ncbi:MAG: RsmE family RNA methyltransferase, partial [Cyanobacteriota bacterium]|nr:RsmE family RNA methyltransferase [Cyanobacteriota bacterium]
MSQRTVLKPSSQKVERWRRIIREAAEQCERQIIPTLTDPISFSSALENVADLQSSKASQAYLCVARGDRPHLFNTLKEFSGNSIILATGPEGGWTTAEVETAIATGFQAVSLGKRILRAVTAPVVALSYLSAVWETTAAQKNID